jgi:hypothetical protein
MSRIYKVETPNGLRAVNSKTSGNAVKHCVSGDYKATPMSSSEVYEWMQSGRPVEDASTEGNAASSSSKDTTAPVQTPASATPATPPAAPQASVGVTSGPSASTPSQVSAPSQQPAFIPPAPVTPGQFTPPQNSNPIIAEQQRINPNAAAAAGAPAPILPVAPAPFGPVDWEKREQGQ